MRSHLFWIFSATIFLLSTSSSHGQNQKTNQTPQAQFKKAIELFHSNSFLESENILVILTQKYPTSALYWFNLGNAQFEQKKFQDAIVSYSKVIELNSPLSPVAQLYLAKSYEKMGDIEKAFSLIKDLKSKKLPPHLEGEVEVESQMLSTREDTPDKILLSQGLKLYQSQEYDTALASFNNSVLQKESEEALMMRALTFLKLGRPNDAQGDFNKILSITADGSVKEKAQDFLRQIREGIWKKTTPYSLYLESDGGYDTNFANTGFSASPVGAPTAHLFSNLGYQLGGGAGFSTKLSYRFYWEEVIPYPQQRFIVHTFQDQLIFSKNEWFFQLTPRYQIEYFSATPFLGVVAANLKMQKSWGAFDLGVIYDLDQNVAQDAVYGYLNGSSQMLRPYVGCALSRFYFNFNYTFSREDISDLPLTTGAVPLANLSNGPGATFIISPSSSWEFTLNSVYYMKNYKNPMSSGLLRNDNQYVASLKIKNYISASFGIYLSGEAVFNQSTMTANSAEDRNFNKFTELLGLAWDTLP